MKYPYRFKTQEEFEEEFGSDWRNIVRYNWASPRMDYLFGTEYPFNITEDDFMNNSLSELGVWSVSNNMLIKNKPTIPSYNRRKIDRLEESTNNEKKYNYICVFINNVNELNILLDKLHSISKDFGDFSFRFDFPNIIFIKPYKFDNKFSNVAIWSHSSDIKSAMEYIKDETNMIYPEIYNINSLDKLISYIRKINFFPSYEPRKIKRTLESIEWYPYRFKTKEEMIKDYGEDWKYDNDNNFGSYGWNEDGNMDFLLGTVFPFKEEQLNFKSEGPIRYKYKGWSIHWNMLTNNEPKIPSYKPKKIDRTLESNSSDRYYNPITKEFTDWPYRIKTAGEFDKDYSRSAYEDWMTPEYLFISNMYYLLGQTLEYDFPDNHYYIQIPSKDGGNWYITKDMITQNNDGKPSYKPKKIDRTLESLELLLEKSSLTRLGVPKEVMQPIQKDFAIPADAEWERITLKRDAQNILRKGEKELIIQISVNSIKVFVAYPKGSEIIYFIDNYIYRDSGWGGEFNKLQREYTTMTQMFYQIDSKTLLYRLKDDFSLIKQSKRKLIKKEKRFQEFTENFKKDFLRNFESILKRIVGTKYMDAKEEIDAKARQIEIENQMMISGLSDPLSGPNSLSILDEFLMSFEDEYSNYFGERLDIEELSSYFSREKMMTAFMYYIYTGKLLDK